MYLTLADTIRFVRSRLDELAANDSDMLTDIVDDRNLETTVKEHILEAITYVHLAAPVVLVEGKTITDKDIDKYVSYDGEVIDINWKDGDMLRLTGFKSKDSQIVLTSAVFEDSPYARMQLNRWVRGRADDPCLVYMSDSAERHPHFRYYTIADKDNPLGFTMEYFPVPREENGRYFISAPLELAVLNRVTGMVLQAYNQREQASVLFEKAKEYYT